MKPTPQKQTMRKFFKYLWHKIIVPFQFIGKVFGAPLRKLKRFRAFLNEEPGDKSLFDAATDVFQSKEARADFFDHIEAFRKHLFRIIIAIAITSSISFAFTQKLVEYLAQPVGGIEVLRAIEVTESIGVFMRVALMSGILFALPYIAFELWRFFAPGISSRSKKNGLKGIPLATLLFAVGAAFAYYIMMPAALPFLLNFMGIQAELRPASYFSFLLGVMFWIGISFEFPLVIYALSTIGVVKPNVLKEQWRLAMVIIAILAAAITPTVDPINMALVMGPMVLLYFFSIGLSKRGYHNYLKNQQEKEEK